MDTILKKKCVTLTRIFDRSRVLLELESKFWVASVYNITYRNRSNIIKCENMIYFMQILFNHSDKKYHVCETQLDVRGKYYKIDNDKLLFNKPKNYFSD